MASITLVLNDSEQNALRQLLDISLRQAGLYALEVVSHFNARLNEAAQAATAQAPVSRPAAAAQTPTAAAPAQSAQASANAAPSQHAGIIGHVIEAITGHSSNEIHGASKAAAAAQATPGTTAAHTVTGASATPAAPAQAPVAATTANATPAPSAPTPVQAKS